MEKTLEFKETGIRGITALVSNCITIAYTIDLEVVRSKDLADFLEKLEVQVTFIGKVNALLVIID